MKPTSLPLTIALIVLLIILTLVMFSSDAPASETKSDLIQFCDADYCTRAAGAFWAKQDSLDAARFFGDASDEALPPQEGM